MNDIHIFITLLRELITRSQCQRIAEPDLVMSNKDQTEAYYAAGDENGVMASTYLFNSAHLAEIIQDGDRVLDLACGPCNQLSQIARLRPQSHFTGIDLSEEMLKKGQFVLEKSKLDNVALQNVDISNLSRFNDHSFDTVISTMSLHHLPNINLLTKTFLEVNRVLRKNGRVYMVDFGRLKSHKSMDFFAKKDAKNQPALFTLDYLNSLKAAFTYNDLILAAQPISHIATIQRTFIIPFLVVIKSRTNSQNLHSVDFVNTTNNLAEMINNLSEIQHENLIKTMQFAELGGIKSTMLREALTKSYNSYSG
jgi:arsenite methyltransferase